MRNQENAPSQLTPAAGIGPRRRRVSLWMLLLVGILLVRLVSFPRSVSNGKLGTALTQSTNSKDSRQSTPAKNTTYDTNDWRSRVRFFVLGVQKGGTTSVFRYMMKHPYIIPSKKEKICFSWQYDPKDPYCKRRLRSPKLLEDEHLITGDFTPDYLWQTESVIPRIQRTYPNAKFIAVLRQPIRRALSMYKMKVRNKKWDLRLESYVLDELEQVRNCGLLPHWTFENKANHLTLEDYLVAQVDWEVFKHWFGSPDMLQAWNCTFEEDVSKGLLKQSIYSIPLARWFRFFPKDQFLILKNEELDLHTQREVDRIFQHLELETVPVDDAGKANVGNYSQVDMDTTTLEVLRKFFRPFSEKLRYVLRHDPIWESLWEDDELS